MKILLIWPHGFDTSYTVPLSLGYLKSNIDNNLHQVKILDCALHNIEHFSERFIREIKEFRPDIVGLSCWSHVFKECLNICSTVKKIDNNIVTAIGGCHATTYYSSLINDGNVDFVFRGEADLSFPLFVNELNHNRDWNKINGLCYLKNGKIVFNDMEREIDLDKIFFPDYDSFNLDLYIKKGYHFNTKHKRNAPIWVTRGCPYQCSFCSACLLNGTLVRKHSIGYLKKWIQYLYHEKNISMINIIDDNFTYDVDYAKEFCKEIINMKLDNLHLGTPNGIRVQRSDPELFRLMKKAGWESVFIAPESGSVKVLKRMQKKLDPLIIPEKVRQIKESGLKVHGIFIIGYPGETMSDLQETVKLIKKCRFNFLFLNNFQPLPGTPVYDDLVASGEIEDGLLPENYSNGSRVYTPQEFKNFNFGAFILKQYLYLAVSQPLNIFYMFRMIGYKMIFKKICSNLKNMIKDVERS